jgi:hypothetical protein
MKKYILVFLDEFIIPYVLGIETIFLELVGAKNMEKSMPRNNYTIQHREITWFGNMPISTRDNREKVLL